MKKYTLEAALAGSAAPAEILQQLRLIEPEFIDLEGAAQCGQLVVRQSVADELLEIFAHLKSRGFPIAQMIPVVAYGWDDTLSMKDNNCSAFNYRVVAGTTRVSWHSYGLAIDINPFLNPYIRADLHEPVGSVYRPGTPGTIVAGDAVVAAFKAAGWEWGGDIWPDRVDYQHFQKPHEQA